ncbi:hypothetical protein [Candidatus Pantoea formicae]|uniref:hypothetical protein n=1 Tax=Candidatus Pantoea formicae TaxID=2608355 RepID=UPI003EDB69BB
MFFQKLKCRLGIHDFQLTRDHPVSKMGFHIRVCRCCEYAQASESGLTWREISPADMPPANRR